MSTTLSRPTTVTITIRDEGTRRAIMYAVWDHAANNIGETFYDVLHFEAIAAFESTGPVPVPSFSEVSDEVLLLRSTLDAAERLQTAAVGSPITFDMPATAVAESLENCLARISEDEDFWKATRDARDRALATFDAAQQLLRELDVEAPA